MTQLFVVLSPLLKDNRFLDSSIYPPRQKVNTQNHQYTMPRSAWFRRLKTSYRLPGVSRYGSGCDRRGCSVRPTRKDGDIEGRPTVNRRRITGPACGGVPADQDVLARRSLALV